MMTRPVPPSMVIDVALVHLVRPPRVTVLRVEVDLQSLAAGDARLAHAARDDGRVRGHTAVRGQHAARLDHARGCRPGVVSQRTRMTASPSLPRSAAVSASSTIVAGRSARRRVQPARRDLELRLRVEHRMEQLVELARIDPRDRLLAADQPLARHVDRGLERRGGRALRGARLQEVQRAPPRR